MKDLMANTVGTVELQQLKQKHEQKVKKHKPTGRTSPRLACLPALRQSSPSLFTPQLKHSPGISLTPLRHATLT